MRTVTFDGGPLAELVRGMLADSPLARLTYVVDQVSMVPGKPPVVMVTDTQEKRWSHGEELLWNFLGGLAGVGRCDLAAVAGYYRSSPLAPWLVACLAEALGVDLEILAMTNAAPDPAAGATVPFPVWGL